MRVGKAYSSLDMGVIMAALVVRDAKEWHIIRATLDVTGMTYKQIDKAEAKLIDELDHFGDFEERYTIQLEGDNLLEEQ